MARQHDAHVRARKRLIKRVLDRRYDWGVPRHLRHLDHDQLYVVAARALAEYKWPEGWGRRQLGRYHPIGGYDGPVVQYKDVPSQVLHSIMILMSRVDVPNNER